ncbi:MAG: TRAP transporter small permease subunit [Pseudomonadota bacterium]
MSVSGTVADQGPDGPAGGGGGALAALSSLVQRLENALNIFAAVTIFLLMMGTTASIVFRLAGSPIPGYLDISEQAIAIVAFAGAAYAQRLGTHIRMEIVIGVLKGRLRWAAEALGSFVSLLLVIVLIRYSWDFFMNAYIIGDSTVDFEYPTWPAKLLVPVAFTIWALRLTIETVGYLRLMVHPGAAPVAVPLTLSAAEEARREIREAGVDGDDEQGGRS